MLEFWQDGKKIEIDAISRHGNIGQMVIFGKRVDWGENPSPTLYPLSQYSYLSIFTIVDKKDGVLGYYILSDSKGNRIKVDLGGEGQYLYDAQEWLTWNNMRKKENYSCQQRKIKQLEGHVELLKDILIKQGMHIVTEAEAKDLGLK